MPDALTMARRTSDLATSRHEGCTVLELPPRGVRIVSDWTDTPPRRCPPCTGNCNQGRLCNAGREPDNGTHEWIGAVLAFGSIAMVACTAALVWIFA